MSAEEDFETQEDSEAEEAEAPGLTESDGESGEEEGRVNEWSSPLAGPRQVLSAPHLFHFNQDWGGWG